MTVMYVIATVIAAVITGWAAGFWAFLDYCTRPRLIGVSVGVAAMGLYLLAMPVALPVLTAITPSWLVP